MCKMFVVVLLKVPCILKETRRETLCRWWLASTYYVCVVATAFPLPGFIRMAPMRFPHEPGLEQQAGDCNECFPTTWLGASWFGSNAVWCLTFFFRYNVSSRNRHYTSHVVMSWSVTELSELLPGDACVEECLLSQVWRRRWKHWKIWMARERLKILWKGLTKNHSAKQKDL